MVKYSTTQHHQGEALMGSQAILKKLDYIDDLPTLPAIAMEVNEILNPKILDYNT